MSILTSVVVFSVLMGVVAFVAGLVLSVRLLRGAAAGATAPTGTQLGAVLLVGIGGALVGTAMVTAALVTDRESDLIHLQSTINQQDARIRLYETGLTRMERALDAAKGTKGGGDKVTADIRKELHDLRQKRAGLR